VLHKDGLTLPWWATESGYEAVVKQLLDTGKVDADSKDKGGQAPLSRAVRGARGGRQIVARF